MTHDTNIHVEKLRFNDDKSPVPVLVTELLAKQFDTFATVQIRVQQADDFWNQNWFFSTTAQAQGFLDSLRDTLAAVEWQDHTRTTSADDTSSA